MEVSIKYHLSVWKSKGKGDRLHCIKHKTYCAGKLIPPSGWLFHIVEKVYHC